LQHPSVCVIWLYYVLTSGIILFIRSYDYDGTDTP